MLDDITLQRARSGRAELGSERLRGSVGVTTKEGVVTLSGETSSSVGKHAEIAIIDEIEVVLDHHARHQNADIAAMPPGA